MATENNVTRQVLLDLQKGRNEEANFRILFKRCHSRVRSYFLKRRFSPEDADELTQDVFVSIFKSVRALRSPEQFDGWMFTIALNTARAHIGRAAAAKRGGSETRAASEEGVDPDSLADSEAHPLALLLQSESIEKIGAAIEALPEQMRRCIRLRVVEELTYDEISVVMGIAINTVKTHLFQARKILMERL